ncbi:Lsa36 family surface (lipo)protein [Leptospira idonii]|uniref:Porin n=1 Tax=Leptospira idonii TaxID=1193500 RepID=A0A4R9M2L1_9LEPT|nr:hypothetical protein [Leptospira idonii]TGN21024.1 hypothetical protein EHS15_00445 [Leptospira idonii]
MRFSLSAFTFILLSFSSSISATAVCLGEECSRIPNEFLLGANLIDPALDAVYTKDFLNAMGSSAVMQNVNSSMIGARHLSGQRAGLGYSLARTNLNPRNLFLENSELRELPSQGAAASPAVSYGANLGTLIGSPNSELMKWNVNFHIFHYYLSEGNLPFLRIKNTDIGGRVTNLGLNLRYFPLYEGSEEGKDTSYKNGLSFGFGIFQTNQQILLNSYDRRPTNIRIDGDARKWIGVNDLNYHSRILSSTLDVRYSYAFGDFSIYGGLGGMFHQGNITIQVVRNASISTVLNKEDFSTYPSLLHLDIHRNYFLTSRDWYGILGMEFRWRNVNLLAEYLKNRNSESLNLGVQYLF